MRCPGRWRWPRSPPMPSECCPLSPIRYGCWVSTRPAGADPGGVRTRTPVSGRWSLTGGTSGSSTSTAGRGLLGQVEGNTSTAVADWLGQRSPAWREQVRYVAIDTCSVFVCAIRQALPKATIVVDHLHTVQLANKALTEVRRRNTFTLQGGVGIKVTASGTCVTC
jgi:Transposase